MISPTSLILAAGGPPLLPIAIFLVVLGALLALDLGVLNRRAHVINAKEALGWTGFWMALALAFGGVVYLAYDRHWFELGANEPYKLDGYSALVQYITGYIIEQSLSLDNIFVMAAIFGYFRVEPQFQHRVLFWGIIGVVVMRGIMIGAGAALIIAFDWTIYIFGALLLFSAAKMLFLHSDSIDVEAHIVVRIARKLFPISPNYDGQRFLTRIDGKLHATPLFLVLLMVESADAIFAVDSIPAIFAVTRDPFIIFTSNVFAILGLRSLYFALAAVIGKFRYLKVSLAFVLAFVGVKMILSNYVHISPLASLAIVGAILALGIVASVIDDRGGRSARDPLAGPQAERAVRMTLRQAKRLVILVFGVTIVLIGVVMLATPGPGLVVIPLGLALLATEFVWARRLLRRYGKEAGKLITTAKRAITGSDGSDSGAKKS